jgi:CubicO group peptidase (beta-lactamase class C family)
MNRRLALIALVTWFADTVLLTHSDAVAQQPPLLSGPVQAKIDADVQALLSTKHAPGATIAIVEHGAIVYARGYGLRDVASGLPADARTRYEIGSITKQFTAAAILQLKEAGKVDLNATVATYLPAIAYGKEITIRQLLTHTSGLLDYIDIANFETLAATPATFEQLMSRVSDKPLAFSPGTQFDYSNTNYLILGRIIEVASGQSWEAYVQQHLFAAAGMNESATIAQAGRLADMARGYVYAQGHTAESKTVDESWASSAGGIVSTVGDLQKWGEALSSGRVISKSNYQLLTSPARLADGTASDYGFGMKIDHFEGQPRVWHDGSISGYDGSDQFYPSQSVRIIVLTNGYDAGSDRIAERVYNDLFPAVAAAALRTSQAEQHSAAALLYSRALHVMDGLRQPKYLTYRMETSGDGVHLDFWADHRGQVWTRGSNGSSTDAWTLRHRTADYVSEIVHVSDGRRFVTFRSFFDPTWFGTVRAMRLGMFNSQDPAVARDLTQHEPVAGDAALKTIGSTSVMGPAVYNIQDRGYTPCPNGQPGHALHFVSREFDPMHQLSDVVIETGSQRFCVVTFFARYAGGVFTGGTFEQHYAEVNGYWMQTEGVIDGTWQSSVLSRKRHGVWRYRLVDVSFPPALSDEFFAGTGIPQ